MHRLAIPALIVVSIVFIAACGGGSDLTFSSSATTTLVDGPGTTVIDRPVDAPTTTTDRSTGGWIGGEPAWGNGGPDGGGPDGAGRSAADSEGDSYSVTATMEASADDMAAPVAPGEPLPREGAAGPLQAGSVDDNADFEGYLAYLDRIASLGIPLRSFDPSGRIVARVTGDNGLPVSGAEVVVSAGSLDDQGRTEVVRLRTTADGTVRFFPEMYLAGADVTGWVFAVGEVAVAAAPGGSTELVLPTPGGAEAPIAVDVLFLLDATGSMGDEIGRLKTNIDSVASRVAALEGLPDVRFAMTLYRDEGDSFVAATHDFTSDIDTFRAALADVVADGGGDYPEALDEGLAEALTAPAWRDPASTVQLVFLVADAPPQVGRQVDQGYDASILDALARGVKIFPVASSESDDQAEAVFRQLAQATGARFVFLTYGAGGAATGGSTDIATTDYEELALDDLIVRLVAEELAALTGDDSTVPLPTPTTSTVPDGQ